MPEDRVAVVVVFRLVNSCRWKVVVWSEYETASVEAVFNVESDVESDEGTSGSAEHATIKSNRETAQRIAVICAPL